MGMSHRVEGFRPPDEKWKAMKAIWDACDAAGIAPPDEVSRFFGDDDPDDAGVMVRLAGMHDEDGESHEAVTRLGGDFEDGWEVDIRRLPSDVHIVRFVMSW